MKCPKCQTENPRDNKFCRKCGMKFSLNCSQCGTEILFEDEFCGKCGLNLLESKEPPDYSEPQSYTPKFLADKILTSRSSIEGERKLVTVFFADVANYTTLSEKLDPEEVHQIMDGCFKILMDEIHRHEGTINQFTGDGVMALFGAPISHEDHAQRACHAALAVQKSIRVYSEKIEEDCGIEFVLRIGLNSGPVIVGSIGDDLRMDYTAVGDTTNLASRMENLSKPGTVLISENTHKLIRDYFELKPSGKIDVKGKEEPQEAYELIKPGEIETRIDASAAKGLTRFVGRKNSLPALLEPLIEANSGAGQVVGIVGEAGVGKSRLLLEMRLRVPQDEYSWLEGRCLHFGGSMAYLPILDILKSYFDIQEGEREFIIKKKIKNGVLKLDEKLGSIIPPIQELLSLQVDDDDFIKLEPRLKRERIFEALRNLFITESQKKPLILVFEDLHWIDKTSEEFINYMIGRMANSRILFILLYRPEYTHQWGSKSYYTKIGLKQLGTASSTKLVQAILEGAEVVPELRELILHRAAGNPLFMEEFTHTLLENGSIQRKDNKYVLSEEPKNIKVPETIHGIIAARMDRLEDNLKRTMQVASVIGRDFAFRILQTITGMREDLKSCLLNLQGLEFIYEKQLFPELEYIFKHALIQEVAYNSLLLKRRKEIHEKIGDAIESIYSNKLDEFYEMLAYHYSKSDNFDKAYQYLKLSGIKATRNYANWEAFRFYNEAFKVLSRLSDIEENKRNKIEITQLIIKPSIILGLPEECLTILIEGEKLAKELNDEKSLAQLLGVLGQYYTWKGKRSEGIEYSEKCINVAQKIQDVELMVMNTINYYYSTFNTGDFTNLVYVSSRTIELLEQTKKESEFFGRPINSYSFACAVHGTGLGNLGNINTGVAFCEKGLRYATEIGELLTIAYCEIQNGFLFCQQGDGILALEHSKIAVNHLEEMRIDMFLGAAYGVLGQSYSIIGDQETCQKYIEKGKEIMHNTGMKLFLNFFNLELCNSYYKSGKMKHARKVIEDSLTAARKFDSKYLEALSLISRGRILGKTAPAEIDEAKKNILDGLEFLEAMKLKPNVATGYLFLGELYNDTGHNEKLLKI